MKTKLLVTLGMILTLGHIQAVTKTTTTQTTAATNPKKNPYPRGCHCYQTGTMLSCRCVTGQKNNEGKDIYISTQLDTTQCTKAPRNSAGTLCCTTNSGEQVTGKDISYKAFIENKPAALARLKQQEVAAAQRSTDF